MDPTRYVRELSIEERIPAGKTGDKLADGSVLLRQKDMERMGLRELRRWLSTTVSTGAAGIAIADTGKSLRLLDEEYNV